MRGRIIFKGGPGSGNFGHAGRPGKRGGSGPSVVSVYHGTVSGNINGILKNGIIKGDTWFGRPPSVYYLTDKDEAEKLIKELVTGERFAIFEAKVPKSVLAGAEVDERANIDFFTTTAFRIEQDIAPEWLHAFDVYERFDRETGKPVKYNYGAKIEHNRHVVLDGKHLAMKEDTVSIYVIVKLTDDVVEKGGPGSGHHGHQGRPGKIGGSSSTGKPRYVPVEQRVWQGQQADQPNQLTKIQTGAIGERMAEQALEDMFGVGFSTLNVGVNNAPIDIAGDHHAIEVKAGPASNGKSAQHWRATIATEGKAERDMVRQMSADEKRQYNQYKATQVMARKQSMLKQMSEVAGAEITPATIGVILSADGSKGDVFFIPGFHHRVGWNNGATEEHYIGTYEVDVAQFKEEVLKGGPGSGNWAHFGRPGKVGGSKRGGGFNRIGVTPGVDDHADIKILARRFQTDQDVVQPALKQAAAAMGFDGTIEYGGRGYKFTVDGVTCTAAAHYEPDSGRIVIFEGAMNTTFTDVHRGVLAHEITHHKFHAVQAAVKEQREKFTNILNEDTDKPYSEWRFDWGGKPKREEDMPKFAAMMFDDWEMDSTKLMEMRTSVPKLSSYANSYWNEFDKKRTTPSLYKAVNETLAEVAADRVMNAGKNTPPEWEEFYERFLEVVPQ